MTKLIALVDCAGFYCSCERLFRPDLRGRPIVVLSNNDGCVISRNREAKAAGVAMGAPYFKVRKELARLGVEVFSSNYTLYADLSRRVMAVLDRFSPDVEVNSIDEAFLTIQARDADGQPAPGEHDRLAALAQEIRDTVGAVTGIPVRVSIARTKTLAKAASEYARDRGGAVCFWGHPDAQPFLDALPVQDVWGIGPRWGARLEAQGVSTARQLADMDDAVLRRQTSVVALRTAWELRGTPCIGDGGPVTRRTLVRSRSFGTRLTELAPVLEAVATHAARAAEKLRAEDLRAGTLQAFVSTGTPGRHGSGPHRYGALSVRFPRPTASTFEIVRQSRRLIAACWRSADAAGRPYRYLKTGVMLAELTPRGACQAHLFERQAAEHPALLAAVDHLNRRFGRHTVGVAAQGLPSALAGLAAGRQGPAWAMQRGSTSALYTTSWDDFLSVGVC